VLVGTDLLSKMVDAGRVIKPGAEGRGDAELGVLKELPGTWVNADGFEGHAWNMIALPFGNPGGLGDFRLLLNQANETLEFDLVDLGVPNRGASHNDQHLAALRYLQAIDQLSATDAVSRPDGTVLEPATANSNDTPKSDTLIGGGKVGIHREPGLFLHLANLAGPCSNQVQPGPDLARLANIPHGDAVLAMGTSSLPVETAPDLRAPALLSLFDPLPIGLGSTDINNAYFAPNKHFHDAPFKGNVTAAGFPGFDPTDPLKLLDGAISVAFPGSTIKNTTTFTVDTDTKGSVSNIPFVQCQANATRVTATFWIQEVETKDGHTHFVLQYAQRVVLEFFQTTLTPSGLIQWPHISINTLIRK
jgi:hypothetical protein